MFVFVHIPKTAGTALGYAFDYSSQRRVFWDYDKDYKYAEDLQPEIKENVGFISTYFQFIFGHFFVTKYMDVLPSADYLTCIRHPVDRVVSQYFHLGNQNSDWLSKAIASGQMDVVDFARSKNIGNAQSQHLKGKDLADFGHIFVTHQLAISTDIFQKKFGFNFDVGVPILNTKDQRDSHRARALKTSASKILQVTEDDRRKIFGLCAEDVEIYRRACELHNAEKVKYR